MIQFLENSSFDVVRFRSHLARFESAQRAGTTVLLLARTMPKADDRGKQRQSGEFSQSDVSVQPALVHLCPLWRAGVTGSHTCTPWHLESISFYARQVIASAAKTQQPT
jgi:hypothetical protein